MATGGVPGNGVRVGYSASSPVTYTVLGQLLDVKLPTWVADDIDITTHSLTNKLKKSMSGLIGVSDITLSLLSDLDETTSPDQDLLYDLNQSGTSYWWRIEIPTTRARTTFTALEFQANVKSWEPSAPIADKQTLQVILKFDGASLTKYPAGSSAF